MGTYSFTAEGAVVGYWGGSEWFLFNPGTAGNSCEWKCTGIGQTAYIGVSGVESCTLTVAKENNETGEIKWEKYENWIDPSEYDFSDIPCLVVGTIEDENNYGAVVNFNHPDVSIITMLATGGARYADPENGIYMDYTDALNAYATEAAKYNGYFWLFDHLTKTIM